MAQVPKGKKQGVVKKTKGPGKHKTPQKQKVQQNNNGAPHQPSKEKGIEQILTKLANKHWKEGTKVKFQPKVVEDIYEKYLKAVAHKHSAGVKCLDLTGYLERYLWPHFDPARSGRGHLLSILLLAAARAREGVGPFACVALADPGAPEAQAARFAAFLDAVCGLHLGTWPPPPPPAGEAGEGGGGGGGGQGAAAAAALTAQERVAYVVFLVHCFQSLEYEPVRRAVLRLCSLPLWRALPAGRLRLELRRHPQLRRHWAHLLARAAADDGGGGGGGGEEEEETGGGGDGGGGPRKRARGEGGEGGAAAAGAAAAAAARRPEAAFLPALARDFLARVAAVPAPPGALRRAELLYLERCLELLTDLLAQLPTRRFLRTVLEDLAVYERCRLSALYQQRRGAEGRLFAQLLDLFQFYMGFEIDDQTGAPLQESEMAGRHHARLAVLQRLCFKYYRAQLPGVAFASTAALGRPETLRAHVAQMAPDLALALARRVRLLPEASEMAEGEDPPSPALVREVLLRAYTERESQLAQLNALPLLPNERLLWDKNLVPIGRFHGEAALALPKLNLQFLTFHDYLLRSFNLYRLESAYEVREDLNDAIKRSAPRLQSDGTTRFVGWARMACPIRHFTIVEVTKPELGEKVPAQVRAEVQVDVGAFQGEARFEWDALREHDVLFLATVSSPMRDEESGYNAFLDDQGRGGRKQGMKRGQTKWMEEDETFPQRYGVVYVRGGEVYEMADAEGNLMNDPSKPEARGRAPKGTLRTVRLLMDPAQYYRDMQDGEEVYETLNLVIRRKPKENNFKAVLATIRTLMNQAAVGQAIPPWLHDIFLGYGRPDAAHYRRLPNKVTEIDANDTFLDGRHLFEAFPGARVRLLAEDGAEAAAGLGLGGGGGEGGGEGEGLPAAAELPPPPYRLEFGEEEVAGSGAGGGSAAGAAAAAGAGARRRRRDVVTARAYTPPNPGPYPQDQPRRNGVRFTPAQAEAIRSGLNPGLTVVVGPPGTGKTDVAVQIVANLYRQNPDQRLLLVAHSNAALNDLFEKIMERDIDERHLLRLGAGEKELRVGSGRDFSKWGRVTYTLQRRLALLAEVDRLAGSLAVSGDQGYTCETAAYFHLYHVQSRMEAFGQKIEAAQRGAAAAATGGDEAEAAAAPPAGAVADAFPFHEFFATAPQPLFRGAAFEEDLEIARGCFRHVDRVFEELADYRAFELLRSHRQRAEYLLTKQAKIVAMTCTHAALNRQNLVNLKFKYDGLVMEEAAQVLEVETFIPLLLQDHDVVEGCRLKRVTLIGDHHQLPPVVKNQALQRHGRLDQSLFARLVRLGVPHVQLQAQGRARPEIAALYSWRYAQAEHGGLGLADLPNVLHRPEYRAANAGFAHTFQLVDVPDFNGVGESQPTPYFYQNLGEAEYVVATYQFMRLLGYPAEKISILATYNGQKHLIRDVLAQRCRDPFFGQPLAVTTVDRYQGQQNDYVLVSLVRSKSVGHFRDVRRLVVALSRARLGLYVFGRAALFRGCPELAPAFRTLLQHSSRLRLHLPERWPTARRAGQTAPDAAAGVAFKEVADLTEMGIIVHQLARRLQDEVVAAQQAAAAAAAPPPPQEWGTGGKEGEGGEGSAGGQAEGDAGASVGKEGEDGAEQDDEEDADDNATTDDEKEVEEEQEGDEEKPPEDGDDEEDGGGKESSDNGADGGEQASIQHEDEQEKGSSGDDG